MADADEAFRSRAGTLESDHGSDHCHTHQSHQHHHHHKDSELSPDPPHHSRHRGSSASSGRRQAADKFGGDGASVDAPEKPTIPTSKFKKGSKVSWNGNDTYVVEKPEYNSSRNGWDYQIKDESGVKNSTLVQETELKRRR